MTRVRRQSAALWRDVRQLYHSPRRYRRARQAIVALWLAVVVMSVALVGGCFRNDRQILADRGTTTAEVIAVSATTAHIRFRADDGRLYTPPAGVLYPGGVAPGDIVYVEYDRGDPDTVRVQGRTWRLALVPAASVVVVASVVAAALLAALGVRMRRRTQAV